MRKNLYILSIFILALSSCQESVKDAKTIGEIPTIYPDYVGVTIPANIAPLNFCMECEDALVVDAVIKDKNGNCLHGQGKESTDFDIDKWHKLISSNMGDSLEVTVSAKYKEGWLTFMPFQIYVSEDSIDYGLAYRLIEPGYEVFSKMGIYERNLSNFDQRPLLENTEVDGCMNCHTFNRANPDAMSLHIRGAHSATLLTQGSKMTVYNTSSNKTLGLCVYPYWHPSGKYIAYSTNTTRQSFHIMDPKRIEVFDMASDLQVFDVEKEELITTPILKSDTILETFPAFSADGKTLYFCAAHAISQNSIALDSLHYNLCSISFDTEKGTFGNRIDTLVYASEQELSASIPRPSYDGRWLVYTQAKYGQFPIWHPEADLYIINLQTGESRPMTIINSDDTESFHNWSTNSKWLVFSSRRGDGLFTRPYFTHIDANGNETKPFLLPQRNPRRFYQELFFSYNVPDFLTAPVKFDRMRAADAILSDERQNMGIRE